MQKSSSVKAPLFLAPSREAEAEEALEAAEELFEEEVPAELADEAAEGEEETNA